MLLQKKAAGQFGAVVRAGEQGGKADHIDFVRTAVKDVQILLGGRTGRGGRGGAVPHSAKQLLLRKGGIVHEVTSPYMNGERNLGKAGIAHLDGGEVTAAVGDDLKTHEKNLLISYL